MFHLMWIIPQFCRFYASWTRSFDYPASSILIKHIVKNRITLLSLTIYYGIDGQYSMFGLAKLVTTTRSTSCKLLNYSIFNLIFLIVTAYKVFRIHPGIHHVRVINIRSVNFYFDRNSILYIINRMQLATRY